MRAVSDTIRKRTFHSSARNVQTEEQGGPGKGIKVPTSFLRTIKALTVDGRAGRTLTDIQFALLRDQFETLCDRIPENLSQDVWEAQMEEFCWQVIYEKGKDKVGDRQPNSYGPVRRASTGSMEASSPFGAGFVPVQGQQQIMPASQQQVQNNGGGQQQQKPKLPQVCWHYLKRTPCTNQVSVGANGVMCCSAGMHPAKGQLDMATFEAIKKSKFGRKQLKQVQYESWLVCLPATTGNSSSQQQFQAPTQQPMMQMPTVAPQQQMQMQPSAMMQILQNMMLQQQPR
eukprot:g19728.t1